MRFGCILAIAACALIWAGGQNTYTALKNSEPNEITCAEYISTKPDTEWLRLKDCVVVLGNAAHRERYGSIAELYIPIISKEDFASQEDAQVHILLKTEDPELKSVYEQMAQGDDEKDEKKKLEFLLKNLDKMAQEMDVEGVVQFGFDDSSSDRDELAKLGKNLSPDFVILEHNAKPSMLTGLAMLGGGLLILFFMGKSFLSKDTGAKPEAEPEAGSDAVDAGSASSADGAPSPAPSPEVTPESPRPDA